jgi:hypothetical protein
MGDRTMDNLPNWAVWITAIVVGLAPGLAILSAPRLLHRLFRPRPEVSPEPQTGPTLEEPAGARG